MFEPCLPAVWLWASYFISLHISVFLCKMQVMSVTTLCVCCENVTSSQSVAHNCHSPWCEALMRWVKYSCYRGQGAVSPHLKTLRDDLWRFPWKVWSQYEEWGPPTTTSTSFCWEENHWPPEFNSPPADEVRWPGSPRAQYYWYPWCIRVCVWCLYIACHQLSLAGTFATIQSHMIPGKIDEPRESREQ